MQLRIGACEARLSGVDRGRRATGSLRAETVAGLRGPRFSLKPELRRRSNVRRPGQRDGTSSLCDLSRKRSAFPWDNVFHLFFFLILFQLSTKAVYTNLFG